MSFLGGPVPGREGRKYFPQLWKFKWWRVVRWWGWRGGVDMDVDDPLSFPPSNQCRENNCCCLLGAQTHPRHSHPVPLASGSWSHCFYCFIFDYRAMHLSLPMPLPIVDVFDLCHLKDKAWAQRWWRWWWWVMGDGEKVARTLWVWVAASEAQSRSCCFTACFSSSVSVIAACWFQSCRKSRVLPPTNQILCTFIYIYIKCLYICLLYLYMHFVFIANITRKSNGCLFRLSRPPSPCVFRLLFFSCSSSRTRVASCKLASVSRVSFSLFSTIYAVSVQ